MERGQKRPFYSLPFPHSEQYLEHSRHSTNTGCVNKDHSKNLDFILQITGELSRIKRPYLCFRKIASVANFGEGIVD